MWSNIINELKISTILEKVVLGIIAGIFAILGYYVGYTHLSNGVNPVLIGIISAVILMVACMIISFIGEELLKRTATDYREKSKAGKSKKPGKAAVTEETDTAGKVTDAETVADNETVETKEDEASLDTPASPQKPSVAIEDTTVENSSSSTSHAVTEPVKPSVPTTDGVQRRTRRAYPQRPRTEQAIADTTPKTPAKPAVVSPVEPVEETKDATQLSLKEYIASHPDYAPRKMAREYRAAGGTDSTDDILELMS